MEIEKIKNKIINLFDWKQRWFDFKKAGVFALSNMLFLAVLLIYSVRGILKKLIKMRWIGKFFIKIKVEFLIKKLTDFMYWVDKNEDGGVTRSYLIELAFRNMKAKKNRSIVTIGGMALGVGAVVFLVSIGYGLERLVIDKVAKLDELKMADVTLGKSTTIKLNEDLIEKIEAMDYVSDVVPVISMVSKIKFNNSVLDVMSFGVDERYIEVTDTKFVVGEEFKNRDENFAYSAESVGNVLGVSRNIIWVDVKDKPGEGVFEFNVDGDKDVMIWEDCSIESDLLGYVIRSEGFYIGEYVWGENYADLDSEEVIQDIYLDKNYSKWVKAKVPLWILGSDNLMIPRLDKNGNHIWDIGCLKIDDLQIEERNLDIYSGDDLDDFLRSGSVLGDSDIASESAETSSSAELDSSTEVTELVEESIEASLSAELFGGEVATDSAGIEWIELKTMKSDPNELKEVDFLGLIVGEAYISMGMLKLLGLNKNEAIDQSFKVSYIIPDGNIKDISGRLQSKEVEYRVKGVIDDESSSYYYYQISDAKRLGISIYSQLKVLTDDKDKLSGVRAQIEVLGFKTDSTIDTVIQIENLFKTLRLILGILGMIALAVASLGMFNTMTVSLLERTREVGVMKSMGMLSNEVRELFLAESMIMGVGGGVLGLLFGFTLGKVLSIVLSSVSLFKGQGIINITYIPWFFTLFIMVISFVVGMLTGWYPSKRARQISALDALRYE